MCTLRPQSYSEYYGFKIAANLPAPVYPPSEDSFMLCDAVAAQPRVDKAVDLGCGCGLTSLVASTRASRVYAYDTNPLAVKETKLNVAANNLSRRVRPALGECWEAPAAQLYTLNPPYLPSSPPMRQDLSELAWNGGPDGLRVVLPMLGCAASKLAPGGRLVLVCSTLQPTHMIEKRLERLGFSWRIHSSKKRLYEELRVYECVKGG